jgi:epoxyqueuosine reductase QueG
MTQVGHLSGLGRFGVNAQLITPEGCAGRLGSLVTEADFGDHPLMGDTEPCLYKRGEDCLKCMEVCPVKAVTLEGIDRTRCYKRLKAAQKARAPGGPPRVTRRPAESARRCCRAVSARGWIEMGGWGRWVHRR